MTLAIDRIWLEEGRVYRTRDLSVFSTDTTRLAKRLVEEGALVCLEHGLFVHPKRGRFGFVPPTDEQLVRGLLGRAPFLFSGPVRWNELGLGVSTVFAHTLVYNGRRAGRVTLGGRPFVLRRVRFPSAEPLIEWSVVDLLEHAEQAGTSQTALAPRVRTAVDAGRFDATRLLQFADEYATRRTSRLVRRVLLGARA